MKKRWALGLGVLGLVGAACGSGSSDRRGSAEDAGAAGAAPSSGGAASDAGTSTGGVTSGSGGAPGSAGGTASGGQPVGGAGGLGGAGGDISGIGGIGGTFTGLAANGQMDVLFVVDNSLSMSDKQGALETTIPDLIGRLTDPASGVTDLHVGVITSSLGGHGADVCKGAGGADIQTEEGDDHGHLVGTRPRAAALGLASGVASWTPSVDRKSLVAGVQGLIGAAGEFGCGFEATLESMYRFLADPNPYASITVGPCPTAPSVPCANPTGRDDALLAQRAAFLRPESTVAIVVLSDENDCSIRDGSQYYYAARSDLFLPGASAACATNPNDKCCYSCGTGAPAGCTPDPNCKPRLDSSEDPLNLRCMDEKRRFGLDFLYPVARYKNALTSAQLCPARVDLDPTSCPDANSDGQPDVVDNPLLRGANGVNRDASRVVMLGIVGVPWQELAGAATASDIHYRTAGELASAGTWNRVLGDPTPGGTAPPILPTDQLMVESISPRSGTGVGSEALAPPSAPRLANSVNGHEWSNTSDNDLQYACIFPLPAPRDCDALKQLSPSPGCDCAYSADTPLCQAPDDSYGHLQYFAKAYPGLRHLALIKSLGDQGALASICARNLTDPTRQDYGYRPAVEALLNQLGSPVP